MSRAQRLLDLVQVLRRHRRPASGRRLAAEPGVSIRVLYHDTLTLQRQCHRHRRRDRDRLMVPSPEAVDAPRSHWRERGIAILQEPTALDFGRTFTARDPDGHRLRVFHPFPEAG